jgi:glutathione S-transferase
MADLRIFSYLPNPRVSKATIAARLTGIDVELRGAPSGELRDWLWDFDARPLTPAEREASADLVRTGRVGMTGARLYKSDAFLAAHPFGTVPAAFSSNGEIGIFESNSIMRAVARLGERGMPLYGRNAYEASRVDSFLDVSLIFARDSQIYLLALMGTSTTAEIQTRAREAFETWAGGIERALAPDRRFLVGDALTIADICFACELTLFMNERRRIARLDERGLKPILHERIETDYPLAFAHFARLVDHPAFEPDLGPYLGKLTGAASAHQNSSSAPVSSRGSSAAKRPA